MIGYRSARSKQRQNKAHHKGAFTLIETVIAVVISAITFAALITVYTTSTRTQAHATKHNETLEGTITLLSYLERDLRQIRPVPGKPVPGYAFRLAKDGRSITIRKPCEGKNLHEPDDIIIYQAAKHPRYECLQVTRKLVHLDGTLRKEHTFHRVGVKTIRFGADLTQSPDLILLRLRLLVCPIKGESTPWPVERVFRLPCPYGIKGKLNYAVLLTPQNSGGVQ